MLSDASFLDESSHPWVAGQSAEGRPYLSAAKLEKAALAQEGLLGPRINRANEMPRDRAVIIYPGQPGIVTRNKGEPNERFITFVHHLRNEVEALGLAETEMGMMTTDGLPGDLTRMLTLSGSPMKPMTSPDPFNSYRTIASAFHTEEHEAIARELASCMLDDWEPQNGYMIARDSTMGFDNFSFDMEDKMNAAINSLERAEYICNTVSKGKFAELYGSTGIVMAYYATYRMQADGSTVDQNGKLSPKPRPRYGYDWATQPMVDIPIADRIIEGIRLPMFRQRVRIAYGLAGKINYLLGCVFSGFRDCYLKTFSPTWVTRGPDDLASKLQGWHIVGMDVSGFDTTFPGFLAHYFLNHAADHFPLFRDVFKYALHAPVFTPRQGKQDPGFWTGNPMDPETFRTNVGLPSGVAFNPDLGKFGGTLQGLVILHELFGGVLGNVRQILRHEHPEFMLKNMGDDMLIGCRSEAMQTLVYEALGDAKHEVHSRSYFKFEVESPITYLGWAVYRAGRGMYTVEPNINSMLINWNAPERSAGSNFRKFPGIGWYAREEHFQKSRMYGVVSEIRDKVFKHYFGSVPAEMLEAQYRAEKAHLGDLSEEDFLLMEKPERLHFTDVTQVSSKIIDLHARKVPPSIIDKNLRRFKVA